MMMMEIKNLGPCPVPQCSLEVVLGVMVVATGLGLIAADQDSVVFQNITVPAIPLVLARPTWIFSLIVIGMGQVLSLQTSRKILHRWFAFAGGILMSIFAAVQGFHVEHVPVITIPAAVIAVVEIWVFCLMRGVRWNG